MGFFQLRLQNELEVFMREDIRFSVTGDTSKLPRNLCEQINDAEKATTNNSRLRLVVAVNYRGQYDDVQACRRISQKVKDGLIEPEDDIDELVVQQELETNIQISHALIYFYELVVNLGLVISSYGIWPTLSYSLQNQVGQTLERPSL